MKDNPAVTLHQQIRAELLRTLTDSEAFAWLSSPQDVLDGRIAARMIALGEGDEVLRALQANHLPTTKEAHAMNDPVRNIVVPAIGTQLAGGTCLGHVFVDGNPFSLIVPQKTVREFPGRVAWNKDLKRVDGALSYFDGLSNTRAMAAAGSELATWALQQRIEGLDDWHIGSRQDLLAIRGNVSAVAAYAEGGAEAFADGWYWSSTQTELNADWAWLQLFGGDGGQYLDLKSNEYRAFVLRREPIR